MLGELMLTLLVLGTIIPVWPVILYHIGKGLLDDYKRYFKGVR